MRRGRIYHPKPMVVVLASAAMCALAACSDDMHDQPRADTMEASGFFADGTTMRPPVAGTVSRGEPVGPPPPPEVTMALLELGRARFDGVCVACHARDGYGDGVVVQRGYPAPPSLHEQRLRDATNDYLVGVIERGRGKMPAYASQLDRHERHAVVAYLRALQLSQHAPASMLSDRLRSTMDEQDGTSPASKVEGAP